VRRKDDKIKIEEGRRRLKMAQDGYEGKKAECKNALSCPF
jgi:hypothetical protein